MEPVAVKENEAAKFRVEFEANPVPVVKWLRYTFPLKDSVEISIENDANSSTMIIRKTCVDDAGIFTCLIENPAGATKTSTNLTVMETVQNSNQISINNQQESSQQSQQSTMIKQENNQQSTMIQSQENDQQQSSMIEQQEESSNSTSESCQKQSFISQTHVTSKSFSKQSTSQQSSSSTTQQYDILLPRIFRGSLGFE